MNEEVIKRHKRRVWLFVGGAVVVMLLILFAAYFWDESLEDHSDLVPEKLATSDGDRVYHMWVNEVFPLLDEDAWEVFDEENADDLVAGRVDWGSDAARVLLAANKECLDNVLRVDREGAFVMPQPASYFENESSFSEFRLIAKNLQLRALVNAADRFLTSGAPFQAQCNSQSHCENLSPQYFRI